MIHNAVENTTLIRALQEDLNDASKWAALAESQSTSAARAEILRRAVETLPSNQDLWERFVDAKVQSDRANSLDALSDALSLFPHNVSLWQRMFSLFPSVAAYTTALRHLDNDLVWPAYLQYLHESPQVSPAQRLAGYQHYCEYAPTDPHALGGLTQRLMALGQATDAATLLLSQSCHDWRIWEPLVRHEAASAGLIESAARIFPHLDGVLVPLLAQKLSAGGELTKARSVLLHAVSNPSSVAAFCELFRVVCEHYETSITSTLRNKGSGATEVARVLAEFGNLLRKRPMYLSDAAVREHPNRVRLWKDRAQLWKHRPHIAADVLETALKTIDPAHAHDGDLSDLWIEYTRLLIANGSDVSLARAMLVKALDTHFATAAEKAKLYIALAELEQDGARDTAAAVRVLERAIATPALTANSKLWTVYMSTLIEAKSTTVLEAFSNCCTRQTVSMRIVLMVAKSFPDASDNQVVVFDKGVQLFPFPIALPLWKQYLVAVQTSCGISELRALYERALKGAEGHRRATEELQLLYSRAERGHANGSRLLAKRALGGAVNGSKNPALWQEFIDLHDDAADKRSLYEQAINKLDDKEAALLALSMAEFETGLGDIERARAIYRYAVQLSEELDHERALLLEEWQAFERKHGNESTLQEMATIINPSLSIHFVPSTEMES